MKKRTREEMAVYQRNRRGRVTPACNTDVTPAKIVTPVPPCHRCKVLEARVLILEEEVRLLRGERKEVLAVGGRMGSKADNPVDLFRRVVAEKEMRLRDGL